MLKILFFIGVVLLSIFIFVFRRFLINLPKLVYWLIVDACRKDNDLFNEYGCHFFVGKQGAGKTIAIVDYLERLRLRYPKIKIYTNMGYTHETAPLTSLNDLLDIDKYNGKFGTVFVLDEIQNEFSASTSLNFPETLLSVVTQQRKNRILILASSQVFTRVSKPLREQCYIAVECKTFLGRYTMCRYYDGIDYADSVDKSEDYKLKHRRRLKYHAFVQSDSLRDCYDSYKLIERLSRVGFVPKIK